MYAIRSYYAASMDFKINFAIVDLPDPDSPARTNTSPFFTANDTSSVAFTVEVLELKRLFLTKYFFKCSIFKISSNDYSKNKKYIKR